MVSFEDIVSEIPNLIFVKKRKNINNLPSLGIPDRVKAILHMYVMDHVIGLLRPISSNETPCCLMTSFIENDQVRTQLPKEENVRVELAIR